MSLPSTNEEKKMPYPFDYTGLAQTNLITNEKTSITIANGINAYLIVPEAAPFFGHTLVIVDENGNTLTRDVDYFLTHPWEQANAVTNSDIYGSITLMPTYNVGIYSLNYQTIGGVYVTNKANIIQSGMVATVEEYLNIDWETAPTAFPPTPHTQELSSVNGLSVIVKSLYEIANALREPNTAVVYDDISDILHTDISSTFGPLVDMVQAHYETNSELGNVVTKVSQLTAGDFKIADDLVNINHLSATTHSGLTLRSGKLVISPEILPVWISFEKPFPNKCFYVDVKCNCVETDRITNDTVITGFPTKTGLRIKIDLDLNPSTKYKDRIISYFAIGI